MRCINCGIATQRLRRHITASLPRLLLTILAGWLTTEVPMDANICHPCFEHLSLERAGDMRLFGHTMVCITCGRSVRNAQHHAVERNNSMLQNLPRSHSAFHQVMNYACHACWMRHQRGSNQDQNRFNIPEPEPQPVPEPEPELEPALRPAIAIFDGTYVYLQKSSNYLFQKKTYSLHKYGNLVKPFMIVSCDGHIIDVVGPFAATQTDADIMTYLFQEEDSPYRQLFQQNDVFILDRGFRDAIPLLERIGFQIRKPESLDHGQTQLTSDQANKSRKVMFRRAKGGGL